MAIRVSTRLCPDVAQVGVGSGVVINESRFTFTGQRGIVVLLYTIQLDNAAAVAIDGAGFLFVGSVAIVVQGPAVIPLPAVAGSVARVTGYAVVIDPATDSFIEGRMLLTGGTVDVIALGSSIMALSFEHGPGEGPTATVQ